MQDEISRPQVVAPTDEERWRMITAIEAQVQASLALSRATLCTLAALSPLLASVADAALEHEIDALADRAASTSQQAMAFVGDVRLSLQRMPTEARGALTLEQALVDAAGALPAERSAR
jgi:hypothetical protein